MTEVRINSQFWKRYILQKLIPSNISFIWYISAEQNLKPSEIKRFLRFINYDLF